MRARRDASAQPAAFLRHEKEIMRTNFDHSEKTNYLSFGTIDRRVQKFDILALRSLQTPAARMERLVTVYGAARPIIAALNATRLIPESWRAVLTIFMLTLDEVSATLDGVSEDFKAGKDQLSAEGGERVEMEPKLPVG
jgi:hypothetical protein